MSWTQSEGDVARLRKKSKQEPFEDKRSKDTKVALAVTEFVNSKWHPNSYSVNASDLAAGFRAGVEWQAKQPPAQFGPDVEDDAYVVWGDGKE